MTGLAVDYGLRHLTSTPQLRAELDQPTSARTDYALAERRAEREAAATTVTVEEQQLAAEVAQRWCWRCRPDLTPAVRAPWNGAALAFAALGDAHPSPRIAAAYSDVLVPAAVVLDPARADAIAEWCRLRYEQLPERVCRECGCTDDNCTGCVERTGQPCHWIADDVCSACAPAGAAAHRPVTVAAAREILRDVRGRVAVSGCSRLTAAVVSQEFCAEWIADRVLAGADVGRDLVDLYAASKAVLRNETRRAVRRMRQHEDLVLGGARAVNDHARVETELLLEAGDDIGDED